MEKAHETAINDIPASRNIGPASLPLASAATGFAADRQARDFGRQRKRFAAWVPCQVRSAERLLGKELLHWFSSLAGAAMGGSGGAATVPEENSSFSRPIISLTIGLRFS